MTQDAKLALFAFGLAAAWLLVVGYVAHGGLPFNPIKLPYASEIRISRWVPQGWAFFTRNPREDDTLLFERSATGHWVSAMAAPHAQSRNVFGLNRKSRAQQIEMAVLFYEVPEDAWGVCESAPQACLANATVSDTVENTSPRPTLCGDVGIARQPPVPWAWSASAGSITMPSKVARLKVNCP